MYDVSMINIMLQTLPPHNTSIDFPHKHIFIRGGNLDSLKMRILWLWFEEQSVNEYYNVFIANVILMAQRENRWW